jgi:hypothetical protein
MGVPDKIRTIHCTKSMPLAMEKLNLGGIKKQLRPAAATAVETSPGPSPPKQALRRIGIRNRISASLSADTFFAPASYCFSIVTIIMVAMIFLACQALFVR